MLQPNFHSRNTERLLTHRIHTHLECGAGASAPSASAPQPPPASWLSAAVSAGYLPCLERFTRRLGSPGCRYPLPPEERAPLVLQLVQGRCLGVLSTGSVEAGEERQAAALVVTAVKAACMWVLSKGCLGLAVQWFADIPDALVDCALAVQREVQAVGSGEPAAEQPEVQRLQEHRGQLLRILSLCLARWLPLYPVLFHKAMTEARLEEAAEGAVAGPNKLRLVMLLRSGCRMVRLAGLARGAADGRGDARAAESWRRLLAASAGTPAGEHGQGQEEKEKSWNKGLDGLAPLLPPPCAVAVLPCAATRCAPAWRGTARRGCSWSRAGGGAEGRDVAERGRAAVGCV